jgi:type II secretory pathway pseudopilin PulG
VNRAENRPGNRLDTSTRKRRHERGYVLLTLLLFVSLLIIGAAVVAPTLAFQIKRDREEELVHRGVQYTRAIRNYAKRTGRYPVRTEDLLGGPDVRYIRKLYKDPITKGDFRLLHLADVQPRAANLNASGSRASENGPAQTPSAAASSDPAPDSTIARTQSDSQPSAPEGTPGEAAAATSDAGNGENQPGMLIFGVVSKSKARSIREFDHKDHYNDWLFFYDPRVDRGYEIKGPTSLNLPAFAIRGQAPGQTQATGLGSAQQAQGTPQQPQNTSQQPQ